MIDVAAAGATGATGTTTAATGATEWFPAEQKGYVENKGWKTPADMLSSYVNLEKTVGGPADRLLRLPGDDKPESWNPIYDRLGRPKTPEEYQLPLPEGDNGEFAKTASQWFHEQGVSKKAAQAIAAKWNDFAKQSVEKNTVEYQNKVKAEGEALKGEWKTDYDKNIALAQQAGQKLGFTKELVDHLESKLGFAGTIKFIHGLGAKMGEHGFHVSGTPGTGTTFGTSVEAAKAEITALRSDGDFQRRFGEGDSVAVAKWKALHQAAFPDAA